MKLIKVPSEVFRKVCAEFADFDFVISHKYGETKRMDYFALDGGLLGSLFTGKETEWYVIEKYLLWS